MISVYGEASPDYTIKRYSDDKYSICRFKHARSSCGSSSYDEIQHNEEKLDNNFARAKSMVKQYGLCNPWDWFATFTLDPEKYNRYNLDEFQSDLMQWIRDERKRYKRLYGDDVERLSVLLVVENHLDGAWHMHGFVYGLPADEISDFIPGVHPQKLIDKGFKNWKRYGDKFGFCSLGRVGDTYSAVLYALKYINKSVGALSDMLGQHLYFHSRPLNKAKLACEVFGSNPVLDSTLSWHGKFCSTGFVTGQDWTFPAEHDSCVIPFDSLHPVDMAVDFDPSSIDPLYDKYENFSIFN